MPKHLCVLAAVLGEWGAWWGGLVWQRGYLINKGSPRCAEGSVSLI
jgi:hypothetical protein